MSLTEHDRRHPRPFPAFSSRCLYSERGPAAPLPTLLHAGDDEHYHYKEPFYFSSKSHHILNTLHQV